MVSDTCEIALTYRGIVGHRGVRIEGDSHGQTWTLRLANGFWTLIDHKGEDIHVFTRKLLHRQVVFPGRLSGYPDLYLVGLGPMYCFQPEPDVVAALKPYVEESERANAPQLARYHRAVGIGFLGLGVLGVAVSVAVLGSALLGDDARTTLRWALALILAPAGLVGGFFAVEGVRALRQAGHFARMTTV